MNKGVRSFLALLLLILNMVSRAQENYRENYFIFRTVRDYGEKQWLLFVPSWQR